MVRTRQDAERVLSVLRSLPADTFHACDTETVGLDLASQSPVGNGRVTCTSVFSGPDVDFGNGPRLWIDSLDDADVRAGPACAPNGPQHHHRTVSRAPVVGALVHT